MTVLNSKEICKFCKFFSFGDVLGTCYRFPQSLNKHENNWCGEFTVAIKPIEFIPHEIKLNKEVKKDKKNDKTNAR